MQSIDSPKKFSIPFARDGDKRPIPNESQIGVVSGAASYPTGFPPLTFIPKTEGGIPPNGEDFNGLFNEMTNALRWWNAGGPQAYDADFATAVGGYPLGARLARVGSPGFWYSTVEGNTTNPDTGGTGWISDAAGSATLFPTIAALLAVNPAGRTFVLVSEYAAGYGPEGGGMLQWMPNSTAPADNFVTFIPASNPATGRWVRTGYGRLNAKMAGCRGSFTVATDDTARAQFAMDYVINNGGALEFTYGRYLVSTLFARRSLYTTMFDSDGAYFEAFSNDPTNAIFQIIGCVDLHLTGVWRFNGSNKSNYRSGIALLVDPDTSQPTTRINMENLTFRNCGIGISNGQYDNDDQCSEITVYGANFFQTPNPVYNGGSNSGLQFVGGNITSEHNTSFPLVPEVAIWQEGGFIKLAGGSMVTNPLAQCAILAQPCKSTLYGGALYGTVDITGSHVEVNSPLLNVANPRSLTNPISNASSFKFLGNTGYAGDDGTQDFIYVGDSTYEGLVEVRSNNWYANTPRTAYNMSGLSNKVRFSTDSTSLGRNFMHWLDGINVGRVIHEMTPIISATGLGVTYVTNSTNTCKYLNKKINNGYRHYQQWLNPATGRTEVPPGGWTGILINAGVAGTPTVVSAEYYVTRAANVGATASTVAYGVFNNGIGGINVMLSDLLPGEIVEVRIIPRTGDYVTDTGVYNFLNIMASTT